MTTPHRRLLRCLPGAFQQRFLAGFLGCAGVLGFALYTQYVGGLQPCPLCTFQRGAFVVLAAVFLSGAMHNPRGPRLRAAYAAAAVASALGGALVAARHVWLQQLPPAQVPPCGPDLGYMLQAWPFSHTLRQVFTGSGECAVVDWTLLGLSMPAWSLLTFSALGAWALLAPRAR